MTKLIHSETMFIKDQRWSLEIYQEQGPDFTLEFVMDLLGYGDFDLIIHGTTLQECLDQIYSANLPVEND